MPSSDSALWTFFLTAALSVALALGGMALFLVLSQRKTLALHRRYARDLLQAQEAERAFVAREVHDDAVQHLAAIANELDAILPKTSPDLGGQRVKGIVGEVNDLATSLRKLAHRLHPSGIDKGGVVAALQILGHDLHAAHNLEVRLDLPDLPLGLPRETELCMYRVAQEALRNVVTHSGVHEAEVSVRRDTTVVSLEVKDRGLGFTPGSKAASGIGMMSMRERAQLAGGELTVASRPGKGTTVRLTLPAHG
ncbi:MAG: ATP-binding protein [Gemmataceae bacterium]|nr:ATP-binding protein [Gemmataceae bacterium]